MKAASICKAHIAHIDGTDSCVLVYEVILTKQ